MILDFDQITINLLFSFEHDSSCYFVVVGFVVVVLYIV